MMTIFAIFWGIDFLFLFISYFILKIIANLSEKINGCWAA